MSNHLGVYELLELLDRLKGAVRNFAAQEEKLAAEFRSKSAAELKAAEAANWKLSTQLSEGLAHAEAVLNSGKGQAQTRWEQYKSRLHQAHRASRKQALEGVEQQEGRRKYQLQKSSMEADHRRETDLAKAAARVAEFKQKLLETREVTAELEASVLKAVRGYGKCRRWISQSQPPPHLDLAPDEDRLMETLLKLQDQVRQELNRFRKFLLPRIFGWLSIWPLLILLFLGHTALIPVLDHFGWGAVSTQIVVVSCLLWLTALLILYFSGGRQAKPAARTLGVALAQARRLQEVGLEKTESRHQKELERIKIEFENTKQTLARQWQETLDEAALMRERKPREIDEKARRITLKNEQRWQAKIEQLEHQRQDTMARLRQENETQQQQITATRESHLAEIKAAFQAREQALGTEWKQHIQPLWDSVLQATATAQHLFPEWHQPSWNHWRPSPEFTNAVQFGRLDVEMEIFTEIASKNVRLDLPWPATFTVPLLLTYPRQGSILFETTQTGSDEVIKTLNNILYRLLSITPPGKLNLTIFDPVGLGQSFAGIMHLADYAESQINSRIWTQPQHFEERLAELNEHMEKVIQMYLRNEYATITEYNAQAGTLAEKYHVLVIAGFPVNFSETAARRLLNIATSGARCGVYTLIHWDHRHALPHDFVPDELRKNCVCIQEAESGFILTHRRLPGTRLILDPPPPPEVATRFLHEVGQSSLEVNRVEVPFAEVAPDEKEVWTRDVTEEIQVPIGRSGATKLQYLALGKGTRQHALIAGKTGSGKSTLFHVLITNLALWCSPEQIEFYLVDFKKGVEFKCYATRRLPHARVVAIESDREFGLSVLQRVDQELRRRGDLFRELGVQDLPGYKKAGGRELVPRCLLLIDEFQEFFVEEDRISQNAAVLLDRIVRQGRAFGIHVVLGSQTLGGAYTLARATLGQMVIRIALQCNEADAYLIMDESNSAPRLLSRPGEGIYNDAAGALEGNSPFQTVWLPDDVRDAFLAKIRARANNISLAFPGPMVFEGNAPADLRENCFLQSALETRPSRSPSAARLWLGSPNSIKGPTEAVFQRQSGYNLLVIGQREESTLAILCLGLVALAAQHPPRTVRFVVLDSTPPGSPQRELLDRVVKIIPHPIRRPKSGDLIETITDLAENLKQRTLEEQSPSEPATFLFVHGLENYRKLRQPDEFSFSSDNNATTDNAGAQLGYIISEGPAHGIHVVITCDTYNHVNHFLGRKALSDIAMRVVFQMSASDSASLIETPDASALGLHRALFYHGQEGYLETFRPYALPTFAWLEKASRNLAQPG